jgi:hypothetical protein
MSAAEGDGRGGARCAGRGRRFGNRPQHDEDQRRQGRVISDRARRPAQTRVGRVDVQRVWVTIRRHALQPRADRNASIV